MGQKVPRHILSPETTFRDDYQIDQDNSGGIDSGPRGSPSRCRGSGEGVASEDNVLELIPEREVTCPACLGRHRGHTRGSHCKLGPPPRASPLTTERLPLGDDRTNPAEAEGVESYPQED